MVTESPFNAGFRHAWMSFQVTTNTYMLIDPGVRESTTWTQTFGLPKLELLQRHAVLPHWHQVRERMYLANADIASLTSGLERKGVEVWRCWCL
eukprot:5703534-Amphidinium_carterae.1